MSDIDFQKQISIPEKDIGRVLQEEKKQFRQERRHERIFVANADSKRCPEHDVEGINFILCQKNLYGCSPLIQSLGEHTDYIPVWKAWMSTYKWKLINPNNEINKIFRYAFQIS